MANLVSSVTFDCVDPQRVARFWSALLAEAAFRQAGLPARRGRLRAGAGQQGHQDRDGTRGYRWLQVTLLAWYLHGAPARRILQCGRGWRTMPIVPAVVPATVVLLSIFAWRGWRSAAA